jgi:UDP-glucose 4-epimerase
MNILVTGGAGYIGAITAARLKKAGYTPVIYDLKHGQNIADAKRLKKTIKAEKIEAVIHFAAFIEMGESMANPKKYFDNNFLGSQILIEALNVSGVDKIIFSSTAGVYGNPKSVPIPETAATLPENPYGLSKLMTEELLDFYGRTTKLRSISLRYFNAAGATLDAERGENHQPESHLIPNVIKAILAQREFTLFGNDYPTKDGTCVRDYIHVLDLAEAHLLALKALETGHKSDVYNVGTGRGYSNLEVIKMIEAVSGKKVRLKILPRRPGDADALIADNRKIKKDLGFNPRYSDLKTIIASAWKWHSRS